MAAAGEFLPEAPDPQGAGYQIDQALIAIGSGGWCGRGLGAGVQKLYLPQANNDFILAIICEELGIVGGLTIVGLFVLLLWRGWWIARQAPDRFGQLLALGLTLTITLQAAFNVAVVTDSVPTKGISLPFVSTGGSGVMFLGLAAGLLAAVGGQRRGTIGDGLSCVLGRAPQRVKPRAFYGCAVQCASRHVRVWAGASSSKPMGRPPAGAAST